MGNVTGKSFSISWEPPNIVTGKFTYKVELYGQTGRSVNLIFYYFIHMFHNLLCLVINWFIKLTIRAIQWLEKQIRD